MEPCKQGPLPLEGKSMKKEDQSLKKNEERKEDEEMGVESWKSRGFR